MEALKMTNWNDDRLDKRDEEVKEGFARLESQIMVNRQEAAEVRSEMHNGFAEVRSEMSKGFTEMHFAYASLNRTLLVAAGGIIAALIGAISALVVALAV
jgi:flagellar motor component MotA